MDKRIICEFCEADISKRYRKQHYKTRKCIKAREELAKQQIVFDKEKMLELERQVTELLELKDKEILELKNIINKKDEFIQNLASRPSTSTSTTHNNNFNVNQYFEGNHGLEFNNKELWAEKTNHGLLMMQNTVDEYGFNPEKIIEAKKKQFEYLFKDETTGKWNAAVTDSSRNTITLCMKTQVGAKSVKDPKGEIIVSKTNEVHEGNKPIICKSAETVDTSDMTIEELDDHHSTVAKLVNTKLFEMGKLPTKIGLK